VPVAYIVAFAVLAVLQIAVGVIAFRQQRTIERLSSRMINLLAGVSLLTDTTETGLRDVATEIGRTATASTPAPKPRQRAATQRRIATAARRGQSVSEIAAAEQVSEGEVNLRLQLAESGTRRKKAAAEAAVA
jgi:hypothetical protein